MRTFHLMIAAAGAAIAIPALAQQSKLDDYDCALYNECGDEGAEEAGATRGGFTIRRSGPVAVPQAEEQTRGGFTIRRSPVTIPKVAPSTTSGVTRARMVPRPALAPSRPAVVPGSMQDRASIRNAQLITFVSGSDALQPAARSVIERLAASMNRADKMGERFRIEGHTDAVGSRDFNLDLSTRRAQAVASYLISMGVDANRLEVVGYGFDQPLAGVDPRDGANRRVVAKVIN